MIHDSLFLDNYLSRLSKQQIHKTTKPNRKQIVLIDKVKIFPNVVLALICPTLIAADQGWAVPRTEHGYPDLQGLWTNPSQTPFQRPEHLGNKSSYTAEEAALLEQNALRLDSARALPLDPDRTAPEVGAEIGGQADHNFEIMPIEVARVAGEFRTSLIVDPPNGRLPYVEGVRDIYQKWSDQGYGDYDGPEIRSGQERCLNSGGQLPLLFTFNSIDGDNPLRHIQIVQTENYVVILSEYFSAVRIIRLDADHIQNQGNKWLGDSVGWYEGGSLKIRTRGFRPEQSNSSLRSSDQLEITETFTFVADNELLFNYSISDPQFYSQSVTAEIPLKRMEPGQRLFEYACHEGNYSLPSILRAARIADSEQ